MNGKPNDKINDKMNDEATKEKIEFINIEKRRQALADYLKIDMNKVGICSTRINNIATFQAQQTIYLVGTEEEVNSGIRECYKHNLSDLDPAFIGEAGGLSDEDAGMVGRLCEILDEDIQTEILNEALISIVSKCGNMEGLIDAAAEEVDRGEFLAMDGTEQTFGDYLIYRFRDGQCSDIDYIG